MCFFAKSSGFPLVGSGDQNYMVISLITNIFSKLFHAFY